MGYKICQYCRSIFEWGGEKYVKVILEDLEEREIDVNADIWFCPEHKQKRWDHRRNT